MAESDLEIRLRLRDEMSKGIGQADHLIALMGQSTEKAGAAAERASRGFFKFDGLLGQIIKKSPYLLGADLLARIAGFHNTMDVINTTLDKTSAAIVSAGQGALQALAPGFFEARRQAATFSDEVKRATETLKKFEEQRQQTKFDFGGRVSPGIDITRFLGTPQFEAANKLIVDAQKRIADAEANLRNARLGNLAILSKEFVSQSEIKAAVDAIATAEQGRADALAALNSDLVAQIAQLDQMVELDKAQLQVQKELAVQAELRRKKFADLEKAARAAAEAGVRDPGSALAGSAVALAVNLANQEAQRLRETLGLRKQNTAELRKQNEEHEKAAKLSLAAFRDEGRRLVLARANKEAVDQAVAGYAGLLRGLAGVGAEAAKTAAALKAYEDQMFEEAKAALEFARAVERGKDFLGGFREGLYETVRAFDTLREQGFLVGSELTRAFGQGMEDLFANLITGAKSAKDAFHDFALAVLNDIARLIARMLALQVLQSALGFLGIGPGIGGGGGQPIPDQTFIPPGYGSGGLGPFGGNQFLNTLPPSGLGGLSSLGGRSIVPLVGGGRANVARSVTVNLAPTIQVASLDPRSAAEVVAQQAPLILQIYKSALAGEDRDMRQMVASVARGGA